jgi:putative thiamine transport system substrate-binding protein
MAWHGMAYAAIFDNYREYSHMAINRRRTLGALATLALSPWASAQTSSAWQRIAQAARGQTVYFNAWGGGDLINAYIQWVAQAVQKEYGVRLVHVKVADIAETIGRVRSEVKAGKTSGGSADLVWINGENFATMKREGLLLGPFTARLPNTAWVDVKGKPTTQTDFGVPTDGMESPWGMAQLSFFADSADLPTPPAHLAALLELAQQQPGRITYPKLPDFHGTTFVKQALLDLAPTRQALYQPWSEAPFAAATAPLWRYLDALHPHLWRQGRQFAASAAEMRQMVADKALLMGLSFNPNEAAAEVAAGRLPPSVYAFQFEGGTIGNTHFVAIPRNAKAPEAAQVVANFLLSPLAQAHKADVAVWGDPTVLDLARLSPEQRAQFAPANAPGALRQARPAILEPHASWVQPLEQAWLQRYGR